jgi:cation transport ATPase
MRTAMEHQHIHLVHHVPGRSRFSVPKARNNRKVCSMLKEMGESIPGVHDVRVNPVTGSAVVHYDRHDPAARERLIQAVKDADKLLSIAVPEAGEIEEAVQVLGPDLETLLEKFPLTSGLASSIKTADRKLKQASGGQMNVDTLLPLAVAGAFMFIDTKSRPLILGVLGVISLHAYITLQGNRHR